MRLLSERLRSKMGLNDLEWTQFLRNWLLISFVLHIIAGFMSIGFYDMDEHFQVMEFVSYKLGQSPAAALPHEFLEHCRSWFQPSLYEAIARGLKAIGVISPSIWAASFRIFSGLLGWLGLLGMALCSYSWFPVKKYRELAVKLGALLYFLPYLHARTSAENLGGTFFVLAISVLMLFAEKKQSPIEAVLQPDPEKQLKLSNPAAVATGLLLGLSFLSRFQMGFMIFGLGVWCLLIAKIHFKTLALLFSGIMASVGLGIVLDWSGTGVWTLSPYNYFFAFKKAAASPNVGVFPWWGYFQFLLGDVPVLGNLIAAGIIAGWAAKPKNPLTFATLPFVLFHMAIPHKEPRYLFPLISAVPVLLTFGIEFIGKICSKKKNLQENPYFQWALKWTVNAVVFLNLGGLLIATLKPAAVQPLLHSYVFDHQQEISKLQFIGNNPFELIGLPVNFYRPPHLEVTPTSFVKLTEQMKNEKEPQWLYYSQFQLPPEAVGLQENCQLKYTVFPDWLKTFLFLPGIRISSKASVYKCTPKG